MSPYGDASWFCAPPLMVYCQMAPGFAKSTQ